MTPPEVKFELLKRRTKMAEIGRKLGVSQTAVQRVIEGQSVSRRIMIAVANEIDLPVEQVFNDYEFENQPE